MLKEIQTVALVGNPNSGKTSLFNVLTGLNQRVGNYSGVTVDSSEGFCKLGNGSSVRIIDLPGTYSLYPKSADEFITYDALLNSNSSIKPSLVIIVADASNIKRNLLFCGQIIDLGIPALVALTMNDIATNKGITININQLSIQLGVPIVQVNPLRKKGITELKSTLQSCLDYRYNYKPTFMISCADLAPEVIATIKKIQPHLSDYACLHLATAINDVNFISPEQKLEVQKVQEQTAFSKTKVQATETMQRYQRIKLMMQNSVVEQDPLRKEMRTERIDKTLLHPIWGNIILLVVLFLLFQSIYWLSAFPTEWIENGFTVLTSWLHNVLPQHLLTNIFIDGVLAGLGGVLGFVPQIAILFALITLLEDSGYMARIGFLSDRLMRSAGLSGKAVLPLVSGVACAVPAIMSTRTIENKFERLIAIIVTPLMSCSARIPVYTIIISLIVPKQYLFGFISVQGLVMMGLYLFGFFMALLVSKLLSIFMRKRVRSPFLLELPIYREPRWKNLVVNVWQKVRIFVVDAGKIIVVISVLLWFLCNYGPGNTIDNIKAKYAQDSSEQAQVQQANEILVASYAGHLGKIIEPIIKPIGFDWKIGIAIIASFAAREVFVGTMATLYSVINTGEENTASLRQKMHAARWPNGKSIYNTASGVSLMIFYAIAMQCMTTMGIVKRETKSWFYPIAQFIGLALLAYLCSFVVYRLF